MSVLPVWRPERDQVVSPWRIMKTRGVVILLGLLSLLYSGGSGGVSFKILVAVSPSKPLALVRIDTQGLLDRVFPLPSLDAIGSSNQAEKAYSLRTLLQEPDRHSLHLLRVCTISLPYENIMI